MCGLLEPRASVKGIIYLRCVEQELSTVIICLGDTVWALGPASMHHDMAKLMRFSSGTLKVGNERF